MSTKNDELVERNRNCRTSATPPGMVEVAPGLYSTPRSTSVFSVDDDEDDEEAVDSPVMTGTVKK